MNSIKWGIIGCGDVTEVKSGPAFNKVANSSLHAVMRRNADKAKDYAARHNVPKWYSDASQLINDPDVNAIYVATPPSTHEEYALTAMKAGKPVYVEKPMTVNAASAQRMADAAAKYGVKLSVAHYRRQLPFFLQIKKLIDERYIGDIRFVNLQIFQSVKTKGFEPGPDNWRVDPIVSGGGIFHDLSPHQLDLMYYFFGKPLVCQGTSANQGGFYPADDIVAGTVAFESGAIMNGAWCFTVPDGEAKDECILIGSEGSMKFNVFTMLKLHVVKNGKAEEFNFEPVQHVQQPMIAKVVEYFTDKGPNPCSAGDGLVVMKMIDAFTTK
jgi:predicted dehydrogenase